MSAWPETWIEADFMPGEGAERKVGNGGAKTGAGFELGERKGSLDDDNATPNGTRPKTEAEVVVTG